MCKYIIEGTKKNPAISFDIKSGILEIKGRSVTETSNFYEPLDDILNKYLVIPKPNTTVNIQLDYFNTRASKSFFDIFKKLESIHKKGTIVTINWFYEEGDEDMLESGEDYQSILNIPFKMILLSK
jgi:hypothetical protein